MLSTPAEASICCILAGALGDAWGGPYEGRPPVNNAAFPAVPSLSDDTFTTLATCEAIIASSGRVVPERIALTYAAWFREGRFPRIGSSTLKAFRDLSAGAHWALAGATGEFAAGAGAAMRIAPLAFLLDPAIERERQLLRDVARITHRNEEAFAGAVAVAAAIRARASAAPGDLLRIAAAAAPDSAVRDRMLLFASLSGRAVDLAATHGSSGHVVDVVPLALFIARGASAAPLEHLLAEAAGVDGDTDTIASITGQIVGAGMRLELLPWSRLRTLRELPEAERLAQQFAACLP